MADADENDESPKVNSVPEEDLAQSDISPLTFINHMEEEEEEEEEDDDEDEDEVDDDEDEDEEQEEEELEEEKVNDGEKAMVVVNNEELNTDKVEKETKKEIAVKEDVNKGEKEEPKTGEELGENSKKKRPRSRNRNKKKDAQKTYGTLATNGDKPESSNKKKATKRVESMGMVFMCSSKTKTDCFRYKVLGLPGNKKDQVAKIYKGMRLFLFDVDLRLMYGIYKAAEAGGFNLEPKAFNAEFPSQVRFTVLEDCLPLAEEKFKGVLKENYYSRNKFEGLLKLEQVGKLCKLFVEMGRGGAPGPKPPIKPRRTRPVEIHQIRGDESRRSRAVDGPYSSRPRRTRQKPLRPREEERPRPRSPPRREKRRYTDYEREHERERERPVLYEREPVLRYLPPPLPPPAAVSPVRLYTYERKPSDIPSYVRDYRVVDDRDPYYSREPPSYREPVYTLPPEYHIVSREYHHHALQTQPEYRLSGGSRLPSYRDVELGPPDYRSTAPSMQEYRPRTHYRY